MSVLARRSTRDFSAAIMAVARVSLSRTTGAKWAKQYYASWLPVCTLLMDDASEVANEIITPLGVFKQYPLQVFSSTNVRRIMRPWITMECSQPVAWTTNRSLHVVSRARTFQEDRPSPARHYPELHTWMVVRSGVISVFPTHSENAPASPDIQPTTWLCPACVPSTNSIPAPIQPTIAMTTTHVHQL